MSRHTIHHISRMLFHLVVYLKSKRCGASGNFAMAYHECNNNNNTCGLPAPRERPLAWLAVASQLMERICLLPLCRVDFGNSLNIKLTLTCSGGTATGIAATAHGAPGRKPHIRVVATPVPPPTPEEVAAFAELQRGSRMATSPIAAAEGAPAAVPDVDVAAAVPAAEGVPTVLPAVEAVAAAVPATEGVPTVLPAVEATPAVVSAVQASAAVPAAEGVPPGVPAVEAVAAAVPAAIEPAPTSVAMEPPALDVESLPPAVATYRPLFM